MNVHFCGTACTTLWGFYQDSSRIALRLEADDKLIATASINVPLQLEMDEIVIKDYAENEGMVAALIEGGVIEKEFTPLYVGSYGSPAARCKLTACARAEAYGLSTVVAHSGVSSLICDR